MSPQDKPRESDQLEEIGSHHIANNDCRKVTALVLLDLSAAACDTIDYVALLNRLATDVRVTGIALNLLRSYLSDRAQVVSCADNLSSSRPVTCGVPKGSVLGPLLFCIYTRQLEQIIECRKLQCFTSMFSSVYHLYADGTQIYFPFDRALPNLQWIGSAVVLATFKRGWQITF